MNTYFNHIYNLCEKLIPFVKDPKYNVTLENGSRVKSMQVDVIVRFSFVDSSNRECKVFIYPTDAEQFIRIIEGISVTMEDTSHFVSYVEWK